MADEKRANRCKALKVAQKQRSATSATATTASVVAAVLRVLSGTRREARVQFREVSQTLVPAVCPGPPPPDPSLPQTPPTSFATLPGCGAPSLQPPPCWSVTSRILAPPPEPGGAPLGGGGPGVHLRLPPNAGPITPAHSPERSYPSPGPPGWAPGQPFRAQKNSPAPSSTGLLCFSTIGRWGPGSFSVERASLCLAGHLPASLVSTG